jgi:hypothetical protein
MTSLDAGIAAPVRFARLSALAPGLALTAAIAGVAFALRLVPGVATPSPMILAVAQYGRRAGRRARRRLLLAALRVALLDHPSRASDHGGPSRPARYLSMSIGPARGNRNLDRSPAPETLSPSGYVVAQLNVDANTLLCASTPAVAEVGFAEEPFQEFWTARKAAKDLGHFRVHSTSLRRNSNRSDQFMPQEKSIGHF